MATIRSFVLIVALSIHIVLGFHFDHAPFKKTLAQRQQSNNSSTTVVDLGYEIYEGSINETSGVRSFQGIRYAASTEGKNRWQPPQHPVGNRDKVIEAKALPQRCPQGSVANPSAGQANYTGTEDCLFLSVYGATNATNRPVLVWIHGGGYGNGQGSDSMLDLMASTNNAFISVVIQYRLAAFGFLASDEVERFGTLNCGILDQTFALHWVQNYIHLFGGDKNSVTIGGESAGGGSVMLQTMAYGGELGTSLFKNAIASSPYLPLQWGYADASPSQGYYAFAQAAGCLDATAFGGKNQTIFQCLVAKDSATLQKASDQVSKSGRYKTWAFLPVTDGHFIQRRPTEQLASGQPLNGLKLLTGSNSNEAASFVIGGINTEVDFEFWLRGQLPLFSDKEIAEVLAQYPSTTEPVNPNDPKYATAGDSGATAVNVSTFATGQQQRAFNLYAEITFDCSGYYLSSGFSSGNKEAYKYQFSVIPGYHGADLAPFLGSPFLTAADQNISPDFHKATQAMWANFILNSNPSISNALANGASSNSTAVNPASQWPKYSPENPIQLNLNETGGEPYINPDIPATHYGGPTLRNDIRAVNARTWEGGRGDRCEFWRRMGAKVPM